MAAATRGSKTVDFIGSLEIFNEETGDTASIVQMNEVFLSSYQSRGSE